MTDTSGTHSGVAVQGTKGFGRGRSLHADQDFQPGDLVTVFAYPLVAFPDAANVKTTCNHCLATNVKVSGCTGCDKAVWYCGSQCQRANWKLVHSKECRVFRVVKGAVGKDWLPTPVRSLVQLLLRWPEVQRVVDGLEGNVGQFQARTELWENMKLQAYAGIHYAGRKEDDDNLHMALEILCKIQTNSFDRHDADTGQSGTFLDPLLAMINHSCLPNAVVVFSKRKAYVRAETAIKKGDEITISYTDYTQPLTSRRRELELYHFQCPCRRCGDDMNVYQVCQTSEMLALNATSFGPGVEMLRDPPVDMELSRQTAWRSQVESIYIACARRDRSPNVLVDERRERLRANWMHCRPLISARMWAIEPLAQTFQLATLYYLATNNLTSALSIACFAAIHCDPYQYVAPFKQFRLSGLMLIAKVLTQTSIPDREELSKLANPRVIAVMDRSDQASILHAILLLVVKLAPLGYSDDWAVLEEARVMLAGIESVPGRDNESELLRQWVAGSDQQDALTAAQAFFEERVLKPVRELAELALVVLESDLRLPRPV